jgi:hypothetical protein
MNFMCLLQLLYALLIVFCLIESSKYFMRNTNYEAPHYACTFVALPEREILVEDPQYSRDVCVMQRLLISDDRVHVRA